MFKSSHDFSYIERFVLGRLLLSCSSNQNNLIMQKRRGHLITFQSAHRKGMETTIANFIILLLFILPFNVSSNEDCSIGKASW